MRIGNWRDHVSRDGLAPAARTGAPQLRFDPRGLGRFSSHGGAWGRPSPRASRQRRENDAGHVGHVGPYMAK
jgi:hypothetical protein